jgi:hypothetical protein
LYKILVLPDTREIRITTGFSDKYFTPSGLADFMESVNTLRSDVKLITQTDLPDFRLQRIKNLRNVRTSDELTYILQAKPQEFISLIEHLCDSYTSAYSETLLANNKVSSLQLTISKLQAELERMRKDLQNSLNREQETASKLHLMVSRVNSSYNKHVDQTALLDIKAHSYAKILYIKEITRVRYIDTLVFYLQEILRITYGVPARVTVIEPFYAYERSGLYPSMKPHRNLSYADVHRADIFMAGFQSNLMQDILRNSANNEYLIVIDRGGFGRVHINAPKTEYIWTAADLRDIAATSFSPVNSTVPNNENIISYSSETLHIPHIANFNGLSFEKKLTAYSSLPIVQKILGLTEKGR